MEWQFDLLGPLVKSLSRVKLVDLHRFLYTLGERLVVLLTVLGSLALTSAPLEARILANSSVFSQELLLEVFEMSNEPDKLAFNVSTVIKTLKGPFKIKKLVESSEAHINETVHHRQNLQVSPRTASCTCSAASPTVWCGCRATRP